MTRQKTQIRKIENAIARQVTCSKRKRGLFKKAQELSILCDAELALVVFSANGKLFEYSTSSMQKLFEQHTCYSENLEKFNQPSLELQVGLDDRATLNKEIIERSNEIAIQTQKLRQLRGEELQGLSVEELKQLENKLERSLICVLQTKEAKLLEDNKRLKLMVNENQGQIQVSYQGQPSYTGVPKFYSATNVSKDHDDFDTSLKLGLH